MRFQTLLKFNLRHFTIDLSLEGFSLIMRLVLLKLEDFLVSFCRTLNPFLFCGEISRKNKKTVGG